MTFHSFKATGPLKDYVKHFWVLEGKASAERPYIHNYFADTCPELLFYFKGCFHELATGHPSAIKTGIAGQSQKNRKLISTGDFGVLGVYLTQKGSDPSVVAKTVWTAVQDQSWRLRYVT